LLGDYNRVRTDQSWHVGPWRLQPSADGPYVPLRQSQPSSYTQGPRPTSTRAPHPVLGLGHFLVPIIHETTRYIGHWSIVRTRSNASIHVRDHSWNSALQRCRACRFLLPSLALPRHQRSSSPKERSGTLVSPPLSHLVLVTERALRKCSLRHVAHHHLVRCLTRPCPSPLHELPQLALHLMHGTLSPIHSLAISISTSISERLVQREVSALVVINGAASAVTSSSRISGRANRRLELSLAAA